LAKYKDKVCPLKASLIYNLLKNTDLGAGETATDQASGYVIGVLKNDSPFHCYYDYSQEIDLTTIGIEYVQSVNNRLESLRNQKINFALLMDQVQKLCVN